MKNFFSMLAAALFAALVGIAKYFKTKSERLEAERLERDISEREHVARMSERRQAVLREHDAKPPPDVTNRRDFE